jgi:hypothetical protein
MPDYGELERAGLRYGVRTKPSAGYRMKRNYRRLDELFRPGPCRLSGLGTFAFAVVSKTIL